MQVIEGLKKNEDRESELNTLKESRVAVKSDREKSKQPPSKGARKLSPNPGPTSANPGQFNNLWLGPFIKTELKLGKFVRCIHKFKIKVYYRSIHKIVYNT